MPGIEYQRTARKLDDELKHFRNKLDWGAFLSISNTGAEAGYDTQGLPKPDKEALQPGRKILEDLVNSRQSVGTLSLEQMFSLTEIPDALGGGSLGNVLRRYFQQKIMPNLWKLMQEKAEDDLQASVNAFWISRKDRLTELVIGPYKAQLLDVDRYVVQRFDDYSDYGQQLNFLTDSASNGTPFIQHMYNTLESGAKALNDALAETPKDRELGNAASAMTGIYADYRENVMPYYTQYELCRAECAKAQSLAV